MMMLSGLGRYIETPQAAVLGEKFYSAPGSGMGRYLETPRAAAAGERFYVSSTTGGPRRVPVAGVGRCCGGVGAVSENGNGNGLADMSPVLKLALVAGAVFLGLRIAR